MLPRYMPSVEFCSQAMLEYFGGRYEKPWPKRTLPDALATGLSDRARRACARVVAAPGDEFVGGSVDDYGWMKPQVVGENRRNFFAHGLHLSPGQAAAGCLRAVLEVAAARAEQHGEGEACLEPEQLSWLTARLTRLSAAATGAPRPDAPRPADAGLAAACRALLRALARGAEAHVFA
ncbi:unnamed protein product, partial [Prorocentrum cordatum]